MPICARDDKALEHFPWEACPFEIRESIFKIVSEDHPGYFEYKAEDDVAPLTVALRRLPISYQHVLQWFAKQNVSLHVKVSDGCNISTLNKSELGVFQELVLIVR